MTYKESDTMVFKNHRGETYQMSVGEFRNAARDGKNQERDHRPNLHETVIDKATPKDRLMNIVSIGGKEVKPLINI